MGTNFYRAFEDKLRGSREIIKLRLQVYLPFLEPLKQLHGSCRGVDLGCGRCEWLELLKEIGIDGYGIDLDEGMLEACRELGLSVEMTEAIEFLKSLPDDSQDIVSGFHFVEHIPFENLQVLIQEALRVLKPAGLLILETPNPENIIVGTANFYLDPTHLHPIPSQLLSFLPEFFGFYRTKLVRLQEPKHLANNQPASLFDVFIGVSPDYAVVAQKTASQETLSLFDSAFEKSYGLSLETLAARYDQQWIDRFFNFEREFTRIQDESRHFEREFTRIQDEIRHQGALFVEARSELKQTKIELNESKIALSELRAKVDQVLVEVKGIHEDRDRLASELKGLYNSRSYRITAPLRAAFGVARVIRDRIRPGYQNEGMEPLVLKTVIRLRKIQVYVKAKNHLKKRIPGVWNAIRKVTLPSYSEDQSPSFDLASSIRSDPAAAMYQGAIQSEDEKHFMDLFQRELVARRKKNK